MSHTLNNPTLSQQIANLEEFSRINGIVTLNSTLHVLDQNAPEPDYLAMLEERRFRASSPPPKPVPIIELNGQPVATEGNIQCIQGKVKQGKSGFITGMMAAFMRPGEEYLGVTCSDPNGKSVLHFDTEQSPSDHYENVQVSLRRANIVREPSWFHSYCITDLTLDQRWRCVFARMESAHKAGGLHAVILDGVADIVTSPNDEQEAIAVVDQLHQAAIRYGATIVCTLHENPGSEIGKTRGHLGSQLERKAESNLRLEKDADGVTSVYSGRSRHLNMSKDEAVRFAWDNNVKMHMLVSTVRDSKTATRIEALKDTVRDAFRDSEPGGMSRVEIIEWIVRHEHLKPDGARSRFDRIKSAGLLRQLTNGNYQPKL